MYLNSVDMSSTLNYSIVTAVLKKNNLKAIEVDLLSDLEMKIKAMPDYMRLYVRVFGVIFDYSFIFFYLLPFRKLSINKRINALDFISQNDIPLYSIYLRLFESITIINSLEVNHEKKV